MIRKTLAQSLHPKEYSIKHTTPHTIAPHLESVEKKTTRASPSGNTQQQREPIEAKRGHILVVDDDELYRTMLVNSLERKGHTVTTAPDGQKALKMLQEESFDLVLLDIMMPEIDGYEVLKEIKKDTSLHDLPIIMISAIGDLESVVKCISLGATDYLPKPFEPVLLDARIMASLEKKRFHDQERCYLEQLKLERKRLALLNRLGQRFSAMLDVKQVTQKLPPAIAEITDAEGASLWLWDEQHEGWLVCRSAFHPDATYPTPVGMRLGPGKGIAGWVARQGQSLVISHAPDDPRFFSGVDAETGFKTSSLLAVPLKVHFAVIGVIEVVNKRRDIFDQGDLSLVETLAASAAIALDNAVLFEARRQLGDELKTRNAELDAFAHTVAHDLKGALNNIVGLASVISDHFSKMSSQQIIKNLQNISKSGYKMANIVDELLLLSSVRKIKDIQKEPLNMNEIVAHVQERLRFMVQEHNARIILPPNWPTALGHAPWVEEIWINYVSNGIKYGGQPPQVELGAMSEKTGDFIRFWVRDNGPGLSDEQKKRLFTPFERLQARAQGHGLGLSIVQRIVEKLDGEVGVESQVGQGSTFYFTLPAYLLH